MKRPILVTGAHRTGTTWVGKMIAASPQVTYISEPMNVLHRPGVMREPVEHWYQYICQDNGHQYRQSLRDTLNYQYGLAAELTSIRSTKDFSRMFRDLSWFLSGKIKNTRPLIKDPFAVFSIPWFIEEFDVQVVVMVRHPAGFVSSLKKLSWDFDFTDLLDQPLLMRDLLSDYQPEMQRATTDRGDLIFQGSLLWKIIYDVVGRYRQAFPGLIVWRHEEIAQNPLFGFPRLFDLLGMNWTSDVETQIAKTTSDKNPVELAQENPHSIQLNSENAIFNWRNRLLPEEIEKIREITSPIADQYYDPGDWEVKQ